MLPSILFFTEKSKLSAEDMHAERNPAGRRNNPCVQSDPQTARAPEDCILKESWQTPGLIYPNVNFKLDFPIPADMYLEHRSPKRNKLFCSQFPSPGEMVVSGRTLLSVTRYCRA